MVVFLLRGNSVKQTPLPFFLYLHFTLNFLIAIFTSYIQYSNYILFKLHSSLYLIHCILLYSSIEPVFCRCL